MDGTASEPRRVGDFRRENRYTSRSRALSFFNALLKLGTVPTRELKEIMKPSGPVEANLR